MLHAIIASIFIAILFAFAYRNRGMHHDMFNDTENRLFSWALPVTWITGFLAYVHFMPSYIALLCGIMAFIGVSIGHSFAQGDSTSQYVQMGLVNFTRLLMILFPIELGSIFFWPPAHDYLWITALLSFFLFWGASALSYTSFVQSKHLQFFGVSWCVPGDSSWEELFNGAVFGLCLSLIIICRYWQ